MSEDLMHAKRKRYYDKHADKLRAYSKQYYAEHREECIKKYKKYAEDAAYLTHDAPYAYMEWLPAEDEVILKKEKTMIEIAHDLGRTFSAVSSRRAKLLHPEKHMKKE